METCCRLVDIPRNCDFKADARGHSHKASLALKHPSLQEINVRGGSRGGPVVENPSCHAGDKDLILVRGRFPRAEPLSPCAAFTEPTLYS